MQLHVKAALLSAFVLPGLGQLHKQDRLKGGILLMLANIFLLAALFLVLQAMGPLMVGAKLSGNLEAARLALQSRSSLGQWLLAAFAGLWLFGVVDALLAGGSGGEEDGSDAGSPEA